MTCFPDAPVALGIRPVEVPRPHLPGAVDTRYQATASCGWTSRSIGTEPQAWSWGRKHAQQFHQAAALVVCEPNRHVENRRTGYCRACDTDLWPEQKRLEWTVRHMQDAPW